MTPEGVPVIPQPRPEPLCLICGQSVEEPDVAMASGGVVAHLKCVQDFGEVSR